MVNELILNAVKEASKLEEFMTKMLTTSRQAKEPCPEKIGFMTQDIIECKEVKINKEDSNYDLGKRKHL